MNILWIYKVSVDTETHITTWREMYRCLKKYHNLHFIFPYEKEPKGFCSTITYVKQPVKLAYIKRVYYLISSSAKFLQLCKKYCFDIVILDIWSFFFPILLNRERRKKVKFIMDMRNYEFNENSNKPTLKDILSKLWTKIALNFSNKYCNGLTFISEELRWTLMKNSQPNPNILIWPSGVDVDFFKNRSIETNKDKFCVFYHGAFTPNRGILESVRAMAIIKNKGVPIIFRLVGGGDIENSVEEVIQKYELDGYVELCGQRKYEEIPELISKSDVCLMAYPNLDYWEVNVPLKLLEYMAMEKVVILTSLEVFEKITKKKKCAIFITDNKPMNIAEGILYAYENRFKLPEWGREGRKIVVSEYSWDNIANNFNRFLSSL